MCRVSCVPRLVCAAACAAAARTTQRLSDTCTSGVSAQAQYTELKATREEAESQKESTSASAELDKERVSAMEKQVEAAEEKATKCKQRYDELDEEMSASRAKVSDLAAQLLSRPHQEDVDKLEKKLARALEASAPGDGALSAEADAEALAGCQARCAELTELLGASEQKLEGEKKELAQLRSELAAAGSVEADAVCVGPAASAVPEHDAAQLALLQTKCDELSAAIAAKDESLATAEQRGSSLTADVKSLRAKLEEARESADEAVTLKRRFDDANELIRMKTEECTRMSDRYDQLKKQLSILEADGEEAANAKVKMIEEKVAHLERSSAVKDSEMAELRARVAAEEAAAKDASSRMEGAEAKVTELQSTTKELRRLLDVVQEEKGKLREELREGRRLEAEIRTALKERQTQAHSLQKRIEEAHHKLHLQTNEQTLSHKSQIVEMGAEKNQLQERLLAMEQELKVQKDEIVHMVQEADMAKGSKKETKAKLDSVQAELTSQIDELTASKEALEANCSQMETMTMKLSEQLAGMTKDRNALKTSLVTAETGLASATAELAEATGALETVAAANDAANGELSNKAVALTKETANLQNKLAAATASVEELEKDKLDLETNLGAVAGKHRQAIKDSKAMTMLVEESKKLFIKQKVQLQGQLASTQKLLQTTQGDFSRAEQERDQAKTQARTEVDAFKERAQTDSIARQAAERTLEDTKKTLTDEIQTLHADLTVEQQQNATAEVKIRELSSLNDNLAVEKNVAESANKNTEAEKQGLLERYMHIEQQLNDLQFRFNSLNQSLKEKTAAVLELGEENQELVRKINEVSTRKWEGGSGVKNCKDCKAKFSVAKRKHHCRNCGQIFCSTCSSKSAKTTTSKSTVRVCNECYAELKNN